MNTKPGWMVDLFCNATTSKHYITAMIKFLTHPCVIIRVVKYRVAVRIAMPRHYKLEIHLLVVCN